MRLSSVLLAAVFVWPFVVWSQDRECSGYEEQWDHCPGLKPCSACSPRDCQFDSWGAWFVGGGCIGLHFRQRQVKVSNNECGQPCTGTRIQTRRHILSRCVENRTDCTFKPWSEWSDCDSPRDQASRSREVAQEASAQGEPCSGTTKETKSCNSHQRKMSCELSDWADWTACSTTCGEGRRARMRRITRGATSAGHACEATLKETKGCKVHTCPKRDCKVSDWSTWTSCGADDPQRTRSRKVLQVPHGGGKPCSLHMMETLGCGDNSALGCELDQWTEWADCDRSCGGGQTHRSRSLSKGADSTGKCNRHVLREIAPCRVDACSREDGVEGCSLQAWSDWSECSVQCGKGEQKRTRELPGKGVASRACSGTLQEIRPCNRPDCTIADCKWSNWYDWSVCSRSCGGGIRTRNRVVAVSPQKGGAKCESLVKQEVLPCSAQSCNEACIDGRWGAWMDWTQCSATCSTGFRSRRRGVEVQPTQCGRAAVGLREQFQICLNRPCVEDKDCELSVWSDWSQCSSSCHGLLERRRHIVAFASGNGRPCLSQPIKDIRPCSPSTDCEPATPKDCLFSSWADWSACTALCGGGQKQRNRNIRRQPQHGGRSCNGTLSVTAQCNTNPCPAKIGCLDCKWGKWSDWGACTHCGGQRFRHRSVDRRPDSCGKQCQPRSAMETTNCTESCEKVRFCSWSDWSPSAGCNGCGSAATMRSRSLGPTDHAGGHLFRGFEDAGCAGIQLNMSLCPPTTKSCIPGCEPRDCALATWSDWNQLACSGLCERHRSIQVANNECGDPCNGTLVETMHCKTNCDPKTDCELSQWGGWNGCLSEEDSGQRTRSREISQGPRNGGKPCNGALSETEACKQKARSCVLGLWAPWAECSATCGRGVRQRFRGIVTEARGGGKPCKGSLRQLASCGSDRDLCPSELRDCELGVWSGWTPCDAQDLRHRGRKIVQQMAAGGAYCKGPLTEVQSCNVGAVDCEVSAWTEWDECDATCGGGQRSRQREVHRNPEKGGLSCPRELVEAEGCGLSPCSPKDCRLDDWTAWSHCSTTCGAGQQRRIRKVLGGKHCAASLAQLRGCPESTPCPVTDCSWGNWKDWSGCSAACNGGQRSRQRSISQLPSVGGTPCLSSNKEEVEPCGTQHCRSDCRDAEWASWGDWGECSKSCGGGFSERTRAIATSADSCGAEPAGHDREVQRCKEFTCGSNTGCLFGVWGDWGKCSAICNGIATRSRRVSGVHCEGMLKEVQSCNKSSDACGTPQASGKDCAFSKWSSWSQCSVKCGGGQQIRTREVAQRGEGGGHGCRGPLARIGTCSTQPCDGAANGATDCEHGDWQDWGACTKCSGERKRFRRVKHHARNGGRECQSFDSEEIEQCPRQCHQRLFCAWQDWGTWATCSSTCGSGKRRRWRHLHLSRDESALLQGRPVDHPAKKLTKLWRQTNQVEPQHIGELAIAFASGFLSLAMLSGILRLTCLSRRSRQSGYETIGSQQRSSRLLTIGHSEEA